MIAVSLKLLNLICFHTEEYDIIFADGICYFHISAVKRTEGNGAVQHKFHIAGAGRLRARKRNLL